MHDDYDPHHHPPRSTPAMPVLLAIGAGSFLAVLLVCGGMGAGFMWLAFEEMQGGYYGGMGYAPPTDIRYDMRMPATAKVGEAFEIELEVENTANHEQQLHSFEFYTDLVNSITITDSTPNFTHQERHPDNLRLDYRVGIPAGTTMLFRLEVLPSQPGHFNVNIDANINDQWNFVEQWGSIQIEP